MSDAMSRDDLVIAVNRLMICAMEDIDCGRDEAGPTTLDLVERIEAHDAALRAEVAALREALESIADRACHEIRERGPESLWCPDHMKGGRVFWCDSCIARAALARAAEGEGKTNGIA